MDTHEHRRLLALLSAVLMASLFASAVAAQTAGPGRLYLPLIFGPASPPAELRLIAVADAYISAGDPEANEGSALYLFAGNNQPDDPPVDPAFGALRALIRFDLPTQLAAPVSSATLRIYYWDAWDYPDLVRTVTVYAARGAWEEAQVNWANQPGRSTAAYGSVSIRSGDAVGYRDIDVTALFRAWVDGSVANYGLYLVGPEVSGSDASYRIFLSREAALATTPYPPELVIHYQ